MKKERPHRIFKEQEFCFLLIPKVCNSSIKNSLSQLNLVSERSSVEDVFSNLPLICFAFVRNPFDRLVSSYLDKVSLNSNRKYYNDRCIPKERAEKFGHVRGIKPGSTFSEFIKQVCLKKDKVTDKHFRQQMTFLTVQSVFLADFVGRYEKLEKEWSFFQDMFYFHFDLFLPDLIISNQSIGRKHYREYYTNETRKMVEDRFKDDLDFFKYSF